MFIISVFHVFAPFDNFEKEVIITYKVEAREDGAFLEVEGRVVIHRHVSRACDFFHGLIYLHQAYLFIYSLVK